MAMEGLIKIINELQEVFSVTGSGTAANTIQLPQIVVVGAQSSGKSSVLESLVGKSFLPRGDGLVTRCPAVLRLIHTPSKNWNVEEWCEFQHAPDTLFTDFNKVREEIQLETDRMAGTNNNIVKDPIFISVYSPNVVTLTVVDLPGIVKMPTGDQPKDIEAQISAMIKSYIQNPNAIILAVSSANNDIQTSESLKYAEEVDPTGARTVAVITKLDTMGEGTDATKVLCGEVISVKLGIIGVVNRSQQDINNNKSIEDALKHEKAFLEQKYPTLATVNGTPYLASRLNQMLQEHIGKCLPDLEARIKMLLQEKEIRLEMLGGRGLPEDKPSIMLQLIHKFCEAYKSAIVGNNRIVERKTLCGGAKIRKTCQTSIDEVLTGLEKCTIPDQEIKNAIQNSRGFESSLDPQDAFQALVKEQILKMKSPLLGCANTVHDELKQVAENCVIEDIRRYPLFQHRIIGIVNEMWTKTIKRFKDELEQYIMIEASHVNTDHEDFKDAYEKYQKDVLETREKQKQTQNALIQMDEKLRFYRQLNESCEMAKNLIVIYFRIVVKNLRDHFRKSLAYHMVNYAMDHLSTELMMKMFPHEVEVLIQESPHTARERNEAQRMIEGLVKAGEVIEKTRSQVLFNAPPKYGRAEPEEPVLKSKERKQRVDIPIITESESVSRMSKKAKLRKLFRDMKINKYLQESGN